nr:spaetzle-processing enzyme-like [Drosophila takahashii]
MDGFVLTAAHCLSFEETYLRLGDFLVVNPEPDCSSGVCKPRAERIIVERKIVHRYYNTQGKSRFDIGMFRMERTVEYSAYIRPICLLVDEQKSDVTQFKISGWGLNERGEYGQTLLKADVYGVDSSYCENNYGLQLDLSQICVGSTVSRTCPGDSGGPLSAELPYGEKSLHFQLGLNSYGSRVCINQGGFEVSTNVTYYMDWILDVIKVHEPQRATGDNWHSLVIIQH